MKMDTCVISDVLVDVTIATNSGPFYDRTPDSSWSISLLLNAPALELLATGLTHRELSTGAGWQPPLKNPSIHSNSGSLIDPSGTTEFPSDEPITGLGDGR